MQCNAVTSHPLQRPLLHTNAGCLLCCIPFVMARIGIEEKLGENAGKTSERTNFCGGRVRSLSLEGEHGSE